MPVGTQPWFHSCEETVSLLVSLFKHSQRQISHITIFVKQYVRGFPLNMNATSMHINYIVSLREIPFSRHGNQGKLAFKDLEPPRPNLNIKQVSTKGRKSYKQGFSRNWYKLKKWLADCQVINSSFCYPCILFLLKSVTDISRKMALCEYINASYIEMWLLHVAQSSELIRSIKFTTANVFNDSNVKVVVLMDLSSETDKGCNGLFYTIVDFVIDIAVLWWDAAEFFYGKSWHS